MWLEMFSVKKAQIIKNTVWVSVSAEGASTKNYHFVCGLAKCWKYYTSAESASETSMIYKIFIYIIVLFNNNTYWYLHAMTTRNFQFSSSDCSTDTLFYGMERIDFF